MKKKTKTSVGGKRLTAVEVKQVLLSRIDEAAKRATTADELRTLCFAFSDLNNAIT